MKRLNFKSKYQFIRLLHELLLFFINSFMLFSLHVKRIIFCFVYLEDYHPTFIYPSLEEGETLQPYVIDVDLISSSQPALKNE